MKRSILAVAIVLIWAPAIQASLIGTIAKALQKAGHFLEQCFDDAGRRIVPRPPHIPWPPTPVPPNPLEERAVQTIVGVGTNGTVRYGTRIVLVTRQIGQQLPPELETKRLSNCVRIAATWPEPVRRSLVKLERNSLAYGWDSFEGYRTHASNLALGSTPFEFKRRVEKMGSDYRANLDSLELRLERFRAIKNYVGTHPYKSYQKKKKEVWLESVDDFTQKAQALLDEIDPTGMDAVRDWDVESRGAFLLNRSMAAEGLKSEMDKFAKKVDLWWMQSQDPNTIAGIDPSVPNPSQMVDFDGILEKAVDRIESSRRHRFRLVTRSRELGGEASSATNLLNVSLRDVVALNLLPTDQTQVAKWIGYSENDRRSYVEWGQRVENILITPAV